MTAIWSNSHPKGISECISPSSSLWVTGSDILHETSQRIKKWELALLAARNPLATTLQLFIHIKQTQSWQQNLSELELFDCGINFSKPCCCHFLSLALLNLETPSFKTFKIYLVMETQPHLLPWLHQSQEGSASWQQLGHRGLNLVQLLSVQQH